MGILFVDTPKSQRVLGQSDLNLLMGIAPQIAISINNAFSYKKIQESEERFRSLSSNSPDIIYTIGNDGAFTYVNPAWERILGHTTEEVIGRYFIHFVKSEEVLLYKKIFKETRDLKKTVRDLSGTILHKNGSERYFSLERRSQPGCRRKNHRRGGTFQGYYRPQIGRGGPSVSGGPGKTDHLHLHALHQPDLGGDTIQLENSTALREIGPSSGRNRSYENFF